MKNLFVINCNGRERFRIKSKVARSSTHAKRYYLERLAPDGWHELETVETSNSVETVQLLVSRITRMYGAPKPTEYIVYTDVSPIRPDMFRERYGIDNAELDLDEVQTVEETMEDGEQ